MKAGLKLSPAGGAKLVDLLSRLTPAQRLMILTAGVLLLTGLIGVLAIQMPWIEKRGQIQARYAQEEERSALLLEIQRVQSKLRETEKGLLLTGGGTALTSYVSDLASRTGIQIDSVAPQSDFSIPPYLSIQVEIAGNASMEQLLQFLRSLEEHRPLLLVDQLEVGNPSPLSAPPDRASAAGTRQTRDMGEPGRQPVKLRISSLARPGTS